MSGIETVLGVAGAVGSLVSGISSIAGGSAQAEQAKYQAQALKQQADMERAAANREAMRKRKEADRIASGQQAAAAASGGGATDPTVLDIMGETAGEGEIQAQELQYGGEVRAADLMNQAAMIKAAGKQAKTVGIVRGAASILSGGSKLYDKFNQPETITRYGGGGMDAYGRPVSRRYG
jgi:hypothetical protein